MIVDIVQSNEGFRMGAIESAVESAAVDAASWVPPRENDLGNSVKP